MKAIDLCRRLLEGWIDIEASGMMTMFPTEPTDGREFWDSLDDKRKVEIYKENS